MSDDEEEIPDWEIKEEKIPPSLQKRWDRDAQEGLRAGICRKCGAAYTADDLTCRVCEEPVDVKRSHRPAVAGFFKSFWGILIAAVVLIGLVLTAF